MVNNISFIMEQHNALCRQSPWMCLFDDSNHEICDCLRSFHWQQM